MSVESFFTTSVARRWPLQLEVTNCDLKLLNPWSQIAATFVAFFKVTNCDLEHEVPIWHLKHSGNLCLGFSLPEQLHCVNLPRSSLMTMAWSSSVALPLSISTQRRRISPSHFCETAKS